MDNLAHTVEMRIDFQRLLKGNSGRHRLVAAQANLTKSTQGPKVSGFQFQGLFDIGDAFVVAINRK